MADSPVLYVYYRPDNDDAYPGVPNRHITEADWARFSPSQRRIVQEATTQDGYGRRKVWVHIDLVDETEQERAEREAREQAAREAYERGQSIVRWREFEKVLPGPGEVIAGSEDGPAAVPISEIGGIKPEDGVFGVGVRRIIASSDPDHPLEDGDLLVLIEGGRFFTDFSEYATGAMPSDWQNPWVASTISVHEDAGNKMLRVVNAANQRTGMEWLKIAGEDQASDSIDIVYKWRQSKTRSGVRSVMRGGGSAGTESMYSAGRVATNSDLVIYRHNNGSPSLLGSSTGHGDPVDTWTISRFRMTPTGLYYREWVATDSEPSTWLTSYDAPAGLSAPPGWIGLTVIGSGTVDYDWIGVNTIGEPAPKGS